MKVETRRHDLEADRDRIGTVRMLAAKPVSFETVLTRSRLDSGPRDDAWTIENLKRADTAFGQWTRARIAIHDVGRIVLPFHVGGCDRNSSLPQKIHLVPPSGLTVGEAHDRLAKIRNRYRHLAPHCYRRIVLASRVAARDLGSFLFTQEPMLVGSTYRGLAAFHGRLTHLDGLHRLLGLMEAREPPPFIDCFIAVRRSATGP